jgi:hypothetical protein
MINLMKEAIKFGKFIFFKDFRDELSSFWGLFWVLGKGMR